MGAAGLMYEASIGGQMFSYEPKQRQRFDGIRKTGFFDPVSLILDHAHFLVSREAPGSRSNSPVSTAYLVLISFHVDKFFSILCVIQ